MIVAGGSTSATGSCPSHNLNPMAYQAYIGFVTLSPEMPSMPSPTSSELSQQQTTADVLQVLVAPGQSAGQALAALALSAAVPNAMTARFFASASFGPLDINASVETLQAACNRAADGNLADMEAMLAAQVYALNNIFNELARKALVHLGEGPAVFDSLMRLAFKAQAQCRSTTQALADIKHPRPVAFVKQANIAHGPQQINNSAMQSAAESKPQKSEKSSNELLEGGDHEPWLDTGTTGTAGGLDISLAALELIQRATDD